MNNQSSRIPIALQAVFLASNRGEEVHVPPPGNVAFRRFQSIFQKSKKPPTSTTTTPTPQHQQVATKEITTRRRSFFGKLKNLRRSSTKQINEEQKSSNSIKEQHQQQQQRPSPFKSTPSHRQMLCPVREISFQSEFPAMTIDTKSTCSRSVPCAVARTITKNSLTLQNDDHSVASSVTCTITDQSTRIGHVGKKEKNTPQSFLNAMLKRRGYSRKSYYAHQTGYYNKPTPLQRLSYHLFVVDLVKDGKVDKLRSLFATGLSTNPANLHGEGLINLVCRLGASDILKVMIDAGCDLQVADGNGRTPLHNACSATQLNFTVVEQILKKDPYLLFVMDVRGLLPLSYVRENNYDAWVHFFQSNEHELWPVRVNKNKLKTPPIFLQLPNTRPVPDPSVVLPSVFIGMLASGRLSPKEVNILNNVDDEGSSDFSDSDSDSDDEDDDDDGNDDGDDDEDDHEIELDDFDENCSFGQVSAGGYTFDFSKSKEESSSTISVSSHTDEVAECRIAEITEIKINDFAQGQDIRSEFKLRSKISRTNSIDPSHPVTTITTKKNIPISMVRPIPTLAKEVISTTSLGRQATSMGIDADNNTKLSNNQEIELRNGRKNSFSDIIVAPLVDQLLGDGIVPKTIVPIRDRISNCNPVVAIRHNSQSTTLTTSTASTTMVQSAKYCIPENDDGLLFGSC